MIKFVLVGIFRGYFRQFRRSAIGACELVNWWKIKSWRKVDQKELKYSIDKKISKDRSRCLSCGHELMVRFDSCGVGSLDWGDADIAKHLSVGRKSCWN